MHLSIRPIRLAVLSTGFAGLVSSSALAVPEYRFSDLGLPADQRAYAWSVNERGQVVGYVGTASVARGFVYTPDAGIQTLGTLGGATSCAWSINELGQVAGTAQTAEGGYHPFLLTPGQPMVDVAGPDFPSKPEAYAARGNDKGQVFWSTIGSGLAVYVSDGSGPPQKCGTLGGEFSDAFAINNKGQIVGRSSIAASPLLLDHAFLREADGTMRDLGMLPGATSSVAYDVNEQSQVVGWSGGKAFLWEEGSPTRDLGTLDNQNTRALAINERGLIVGASAVDSVAHAFLYENSTMRDLNALTDLPAGWTLMEAWDINEAGQIVGNADFNGLRRAFLLTPVPEPASVAGLCLLGMMFLRRSTH